MSEALVVGLGNMFICFGGFVVLGFVYGFGWVC